MINNAKNYKIHEGEVFAIVKNSCYWHLHFEQFHYIVEIITNYSTFYRYMTIYKLKLR